MKRTASPTHEMFNFTVATVDNLVTTKEILEDNGILKYDLTESTDTDGDKCWNFSVPASSLLRSVRQELGEYSIN